MATATATTTDRCEVFRTQYHMVVAREPKVSHILLRMHLRVLLSLFRNIFKYITNSIHFCIDPTQLRCPQSLNRSSWNPSLSRCLLPSTAWATTSRTKPPLPASRRRAPHLAGRTRTAFGYDADALFYGCGEFV
jgi:hypothetical protein